MKRWHLESILARHREESDPSSRLMVILATAMVIAPIVVGAAICAGWWR
jgi:hypothetical protein